MCRKTRQILFAVVLLAACGDSADDDSGGTEAGAGSGAGGGFDRGSATLTIGDQTWEFDNFACYVGIEETRSEVYPFNTNSIQTFDGTRVQMQAEIRDDSGQGRLQGEGVIYTVYINDIENFEDPAIDWESTSDENEMMVQAGLAPPSGDTVVRFDAGSVSASGAFDDKTTEEDFTQVAGTLEGTCATQ